MHYILKLVIVPSTNVVSDSRQAIFHWFIVHSTQNSTQYKASKLLEGGGREGMCIKD